MACTCTVIDEKFKYVGWMLATHLVYPKVKNMFVAKCLFAPC